MIVNYTEQGWEVISQRAHGLLAAAFAQEWRHNVRTKRWIETLIAIAEHDDAQIELEQTDLLTPEGGPLNFAMRKMQLQHCQNTVLRAYNKSTYIALLCSRHLNFLCDAPQTDEEVKTFIKQQQKQRNKWLKTVGMSADQLEHDYRLLEWCDALSLLLCQNQIQPEGRATEISKGPDGKMYNLSSVDALTLTVTPWPFENDSFSVFCETRLLRQLSFSSNKDFIKIYEDCKPAYKTWTFRRNNS